MILSADDFGLDLAVNQAVEIAYREGVLSSASLMVGEAACADAVARAHALPGLRVGLHLALIEATPVSPPETIPDLVDAEGRFPSDMVAAGFRFFFVPRIRRQLAREIRAQFEAFAATGLALDHVNTHKHIHLHPTVASMIVAIGAEFGLKAMRIPVEPGTIVAKAEPGTGASIGDAALATWTRFLRWQLARAGIVTNDQVFGLAWSGAMTEERLLALVPLLPEGVSEIYFHPATSLTPGLARTMPTYRHADELAALLSPAFRASLDRMGIDRTTYTDLAA